MCKNLIKQYCEICLNWYSKKAIKEKICKSCNKSIEKMPATMPLEAKIDCLKNIKLKNKPDKYGSLSKKDKAAFLMCSNCEWLREIDYINLKIYCSLPRCKQFFDRGDVQNI